MKHTKTRVLVTGATGFFGKNLVERLTREGHDIHVFRDDLRKERQVFQTVNTYKPHIVYHMAALVDLSRDYKVAKRCIDINCKGTIILLEALRRAPLERFIYTSTEEVYGDGPLPFKENQLPSPPSFYAVSKVAAEHMATIYAQLMNFQLFIFRIGTAYGAYQPPSRLIPSIILHALKNEDMPLNSGKKKRDYVYIGDVVDALYRAGTRRVEAKITVCNVGGGKQYTLAALVERVLKLTGSTARALYGVYPDRILEADEWLLNNANAYKVLDWKPQTSLDAGLKKTIAFYQEMLRT